MVSFMFVSDTCKKDSHKKANKAIIEFLHEFKLVNISYEPRDSGFILTVNIHLHKDEISQESFGIFLPYVRNAERSFKLKIDFVSSKEAEVMDGNNHIFISLDRFGWREHLKRSLQEALDGFIRGYASEASICYAVAEFKKVTKELISIAFNNEDGSATISITDIIYSSDQEDRWQGIDLKCIYISKKRSIFRFGVKSSEEGIKNRDTFQNIPQIAVYSGTKPFLVYQALAKMIFYHEQGKQVSMVVSQHSTKEILEN